MNFTLPGGPAAIGPELSRALRESEQAGIHSFWPMDHFFQIAVAGPPEEAMVEVYSTLAWAAGQTTTMQLGALVTEALGRIAQPVEIATHDRGTTEQDPRWRVVRRELERAGGGELGRFDRARIERQLAS